MKNLIFGVIILLTLIVGITGCTTEKLVPDQVPEPTIPADYSTYTVEGLYSISYPQDWVPAISIMDELMEGLEAFMESEKPEIPVENFQMLFCGGVETEYGWDPNVSVGVEPVPILGRWTLDKVVEENEKLIRTISQEYQLFSQVKTTVDGREAVILDFSAEYDPVIGTNRYLQLIILKDRYLWTVTCTEYPQDFEYYEDTFNNIVRSLRILK